MVSLSMKTIFAFALLAVATQPAKGEVQKGGWSRRWGWGGGGGPGYWWKKRSLRADA